MQCALDEMTIGVNGERLALDPSGALYWPAERTIIFADLHFEKGSSLAQRGALLPPYDTRETLARMKAALARRQVERVIALGDSFHDRDAAERLDESERASLRELSRTTEWVWIAGNHDPSPPAWLGGTVTSEIAIGGLVFRHEPTMGASAGEIAGHLHPCMTVVRRGRGLRRRCFVSDGTRLLVPSFGAYTGGLDIWDTAITSLFPETFLAYVLGARRVYAVAANDKSHALWRKNNEDIQPSSTATMTASRP
jgi:DNA ligase-associated metallophosphoesterase